MPHNLDAMGSQEQKEAAARYAASMVQDGMTVGLGSGTTAELAVHALGELHRGGLRFTGVATSKATEGIARAYDIPLKRLDERARLDLCIDGADEVDPHLNLIKGHGGALLREKLVASAAARFVVIVDSSKLVERLGEKTPIPVEIVQFGWLSTKQHLQDIGLESTVRQAESGRPYLTSNHNLILDCHAARGIDLARHETANAIKLQTGVVEHGLFLGMAAAVVVGLDDGAAEVRHPG
jgi:ribose 5-phosphate isomerase A